MRRLSLVTLLNVALPTYFHSAILSAIALTFWVVFGLGPRWRRSGRLWTWATAPWLMGGFGFLYLAVDEGIRVHERVAFHTFKAMGLWERMTHYEVSPAWWEALFAPLFGAIGVVVLVVLFRHRRQMKATFALGLLAMALWGRLWSWRPCS